MEECRRAGIPNTEGNSYAMDWDVRKPKFYTLKAVSTF